MVMILYRLIELRDSILFRWKTLRVSLLALENVGLI